MNKEKKTERINLRLTIAEKRLINEEAKRNNQNITEHIVSLIKNEKSCTSHEQRIADSMAANQLINNLLTSSELSNKAKEIISKEIRKYV